MDNTKKVWAWHDAPNSIYAYTDDRKLKRLFELERKLKPFKRKSYYMTESEFMDFGKTWRGGKLCQIKIYDGKEYIDFVATEREDTDMDDECVKLMQEIHTIIFHLETIPFKNKYRKLLRDVTVDLCIKMDELPFIDRTATELLNLDEFSIFCEKYGHTIF